MTDQPDPGLHELERQVERGNLFAHTVLTEQAARANKTEALVHGLAELLIRRDVISAEDLLDAVNTTGTEIQKAGRAARLDVAIRVDGEAPTVPAEEIDCEARIPYCKAVCCRMRWALTVEEWRTLGASHLGVATVGVGPVGVDAHIKRLREAREVLDG